MYPKRFTDRDFLVSLFDKVGIWIGLIIDKLKQ